MDRITFHHDTVLSDVHMLRPNARHLMTRLNSVGQPVFISKFKILSVGERPEDSDPEKDGGGQEPKTEDGQVSQSPDGEDGEEVGGEPFLDEDGDIHVTHRPRAKLPERSSRDLVCPVILQRADPELEPEEEEERSEEEEEREEEEDHQAEDEDEQEEDEDDIIKIEHTMATTLEDVGKQVWRGAFLLADFILSSPDLFRGATVLELGAGTGLTSIVMATVCKTTFCTDVGEDLLSMCKKNVTLNRHLMEAAGGDVRVRQLDWLQHDLCTDADVEFSWTEEEVEDMYSDTEIIIAADVIYDDELTDGLFRTLYRLCSSFSHSCSVFISIEKRMNFTLRHMDVSCDAYNHFRRCLSQLVALQDGRCSFSVQQLPASFSQFLLYERMEHLELWKVTSTPGHLSGPLPPESACGSSVTAETPTPHVPAHRSC